MNSDELRKSLKSHRLTSPNFFGVYPLDKIPKVGKVRKDKFFIFNLDPSHKSGSHWIAIMLRPKGKNIFFDSYGYKPLSTKFLRFMKNNYVHNRKRLQHQISTTCGQWCIFFIWEKCKGKSLQKMTKLFSDSDLLANDHIVNSIVEETFGTKHKVINKKFLHTQSCKKMAHTLRNCPYYQH